MYMYVLSCFPVSPEIIITVLFAGLKAINYPINQSISLRLMPWPCPCRVSDESGTLEVTEVGEKPLKREHLDSNVSFGASDGGAKPAVERAA